MLIDTLPRISQEPITVDAHLAAAFERVLADGGLAEAGHAIGAALLPGLTETPMQPRSPRMSGEGDDKQPAEGDGGDQGGQGDKAGGSDDKRYVAPRKGGVGGSEPSKNGKGSKTGE